eukprot:1187915-Prorocentrum_minimum.AAC.5
MTPSYWRLFADTHRLPAHRPVAARVDGGRGRDALVALLPVHGHYHRCRHAARPRLLALPGALSLPMGRQHVYIPTFQANLRMTCVYSNFPSQSADDTWKTALVGGVCALGRSPPSDRK